METILMWFAITVAGLLVSAHTRVTLPVLGPVSVLALVALAVVLAVMGVLLLVVRSGRRDGWLRLGPRPVTS
jgi:hypothetical protein